MIKKDNTQHLAKAKNLVRGALSLLRATTSKPKEQREAWQQEQQAQLQINKALALAKQKLSQKQLSEFEKWVANFIGDENRKVQRLGTHITSLGILPNNLESKNLATELHLALEQLQRQQPELLVFAKNIASLGKTVAIRDWAGASSTLQSIIERDGYSYWAIEAELALKQATEGMEALKSQIALMSICTIGLNKFFLYYFGVRNEPAQSSSRFKANLKKKIEDSDLSAVLQAYSKFRLYGGLDAEHSTLAHVLSCEQLTTSADMLFTLIRVTRLILEQKTAFSIEILNAAIQATEALEPIISELGISNVVQRNKVIGAGQATEYSDAFLMQIAHKAIHTALQPQEKWRQMDDSDFIVQGLASLLSTRSDGLPAEVLAKVLLNFSWLPVAIVLGDVTTVLPLPKIFTAYGLNESSKDEPPISVNAALHSTVQSLENNSVGDDLIELLTLINAIRARRDGNVSDAIQILNEAATQSVSEVVRDTQTVILTNYLHENGNIQECLSSCVQAGMENGRLIPMLPLAEMFQGVKWASLRQLTTSIDLAIALNYFLLIVDDRKIRTYKRYAVEELMKLHNGCSVDELTDALVVAGVEADKVDYFSCHVCDIVTLELLPGMGDSKKVRLVRSQILRRLADLHTKQELDHLREASRIENSLQVDDGLSILDDSKMYVDEQAILNFVNKEMADDFQRYLKLVESGLGVSDSLNDVLKNFRNPSARTFQIPKNDADDLLAEIVSSILHRFLFDPASGLDIIIGRRIRHGTIASEIRGYLEGVELIGQKPQAGANYDAPVRVDSLRKKLDPKQGKFINAAFSRFSESIDQLIALLRDEYFHVRTNTKARGIFDLQVSPVMLTLARSIAQTCQTIDQFSKECLEIYWFFLSAIVDVSRPKIEAEIKKTLSSIILKLTNEFRAIDISDPEFIACLLQASEELQRRATTIASWIRVPNNSIEGTTFSMQRVVDVAVAMVTGQRPGFHPIVTSALPEDLQLDTHGFSIVVDTLYIALDNICQHSGKKVGNNVRIEILFDAKTSLISFTITNEIASSSRIAEKEARLNIILSDIQRRVYGERARLSRGSGLSKLAALVMQSDKTNIYFGYHEPNLFQLKFDLVYVGLTNSSNQAHHNIDSLLSKYELVTD